jgi:hypothetical protein
VARFTSAYSTLRIGLDEVNALCRMAGFKERKDPIGLRHEINAMCRGAVVLLSAHLEAYIKDLGESALDAIHTQSVSRSRLNGAIFYHVSKDLLDEVSNAREPCGIADKVFNFLSLDSSFWSRAGAFPQPIPAERFNKGFSNPSFDKIRAYFNRFGYGNYRRDLSRRLKGNSATIQNMVDHLVDTRNKIAHGDSHVTKTPTEIKDMVTMVRKYGMATDAVFATWCKKNLCSIK